MGDEQHGQFWITTDTFLFVKMKKQDPRGNKTEVQFNKYVPVGRGWIAPEVVMIRNGQTVMKEIYSDWKVDERLPSSLFDLSSFQTTVW